MEGVGDAHFGPATCRCILAFPDRETAKAKWDSFHADPEWLKARDEFQAKYGKTVDKVESLFLLPTDSSSLK